MAERLQQQPPQEGEEGTKHVQLAHPIGCRNGKLEKDSKLVNCYPEPTEMGLSVKKRPGMQLIKQNPAGPAQGQFLLGTAPFAIVGDVIYDTLLLSAPVALPGVVFAGERMYTLSDIPVGSSVMKSRHGLWQRVNITTPVKCVDWAYPAATVPGVAYLKGRYYVMDVLGSIYASGLLTPLSWPALNFIGSDDAMGIPRAIGRHLNYIAAFYDAGIQMYYDAGTPVGSPLLPVESAAWRIGCAVGDSVLNINDETFFMAESGARGRSIQKITGLSLVRISTPVIERILSSDDLSEVYVCDIRGDGHSFYVITLVQANVTLAYDTVLDNWTTWSSVVGGTERRFLAVNSISKGFLSLCQSASDGVVFSPNPDVFTDYSGQINMRVITPNYDWGSLQRKYMPAVYLIADTVDATVLLRYSDKDYSNSSNWRSIDLATTRKMALKMGSSASRSWELLYTGNTDFRGYTLQIEISRGAGG